MPGADQQVFVTMFANVKLLTLEKGFFDAQGTNALFNGPHGIALDAFQNLVVVERYNHKVRQISPSGVVTTIVGTGTAGWADGLGVNAMFNNPEGVAVDQNGNIYIGDTGGNRIRMIVPCDGGFFVQNAKCQTCPAGTFSLFAQFGSTSCISCGAGSLSKAGSASCSSSCGSGFAAGAGSAACFSIRSTSIAATTKATTLLPSSTLPSNVIWTTTMNRESNVIWTTTMNRESVAMKATVTDAMPNASPSNLNVSLENKVFGIDPSIVMYASASVGAAALVGATVFLIQRRQKSNNNRLKPVHNNAANELNSRFTQLGVNSFNGLPNTSYNSMMGSSYRLNGVNQTTGFYGPQVGQSHSASGWTTGTFGPVGDFQTRTSAMRSDVPSTQFGYVPNLGNAALFNRSQTLSGLGIMNVGVPLNITRTDQGFSGTSSMASTRMKGNTLTVMPRATLQFEKGQMNGSNFRNVGGHSTF